MVPAAATPCNARRRWIRSAAGSYVNKPSSQRFHYRFLLNAYLVNRLA
jgi:hypothetical protein